MKTVRTLRILIDIFFIFLIFSVFWNFIALPFSLFNLDFGGAVVYQNLLSETDPMIYLFVILSTLTIILFVLGVFWLKGTTRKLISQDFVHPIVISGFSKAGKAFLISGLFSTFIAIFSRFPVNYGIESTFLGMSGNANIFIVICGLFFMLFSKILENSKAMKEENDLTV